MAKRGVIRVVLLISVIFLISAIACSAQYKELMHDGWHMHDDNFTLDNNVFKIKAGGDPTKVVMTVNNNVFVIENNTCIDKLNMSLCLNNVRYPSEGLHKIIDIDDYEYDIEVWYYMAKLAISKEIDETKILIGEKIRVEIIIENDGSLPARGIYFKDVYFSDSYPDFFISNVIGCTYSKHNVSWSGVLKPTQKKICSYDLEAIRSTTFSSIAKATYLVGIANKTRTAKSDKITLFVPDYELSLRSSLNSSSVNVSEDVEFNATLSNTLDDKTFSTVTLAVHIPKGLELLEYSEQLNPTGSMLRWSGKVEESEIKNFSAKFRVVHKGNNTLKTNLNYNIGHLVRIVDEFDTVYGEMDEIALQYIAMPEESESKSPARFIVNVNNPSSDYVFKDVSANISTNLPVNFSTSSFSELGKKEFRNILTKNLTLPAVEGDTTHYRIAFDIRYKSEYGQEMQLFEAKTITVNPKKIVKESSATADTSSSQKKEDSVEKIEESLGKFREKMVALVEYLGSGRFSGVTIIIAILFILSGVHFIKKMLSKVAEYEKYEKGG